MESLSGSVSTYRVVPCSIHPPPPRDFSCFKTPTASLHHHQQQQQRSPHRHLSAKPNSHTAAASTRTSSPTVRNRPTSSLRTTNSPLVSAAPAPAPPPPHTHRRPASGYAAALLDIARCRGALDAVQQDVRRLSRLLRREPIRNFLADPSIGNEAKVGVVEQLGKRGRIGELLMGLVKMLSGRNRVGVLGEVLSEFERICDEMFGTQRVVVSSVKKMGEGEMIRIARSVHKLSGGKSVKVRNFVDDVGVSPSFAL